VAATVTEGEALALALADPGVAKFVEAPPRKVIFVPRRLLNLVP
jgi:hypothetical protein